jgi:hypothetical protein
LLHVVKVILFDDITLQLRDIAVHGPPKFLQRVVLVLLVHSYQHRGFSHLRHPLFQGISCCLDYADRLLGLGLPCHRRILFSDDILNKCSLSTNVCYNLFQEVVHFLDRRVYHVLAVVHLLAPRANFLEPLTNRDSSLI